jgi:adenine-specific DNA-methyltransferase
MVSICDPAVGSGAFLLGMMQEIVQLRRGILYSHNEYIEAEEEDKQITDWKYRAVTWNLHGVDINPEAVDICQLRLWLSLVLDQKDPTIVEPLPNLDFRIVAGDSLIDRIGEIAFNRSLPPEYQPPMELGSKLLQEEQQIERWQHEFEATQDNPKRLRELRENIARANKRVIRLQIEAELKKAQDESQMYSGLNRNKNKASAVLARAERLQQILDNLDVDQPYQSPFLWPVAFPDVFRQGGFDIVLANPPYVRQEKLSAEDQESYKLSFNEVFTGTADILVFFYARAFQILRDSGYLAFITSNKYMRAGYGEGLRQKLSGNLILNRVIDFGDLPIFEANGKQVSAYPAVLVGKKRDPPDDIIISVADLTYPIRSALSSVNKTVNPENVRWAIEDLNVLLKEHGKNQYPQLLLRKEDLGWILEDPKAVSIFSKLMSQGVPLGKFVSNNIFIGIKTGFNDAFIIDEIKRRELISEDSRSAKLIKPWLRGRDIKQWKAEWSNLYIIAMQNSGDSDSINPWKGSSTETEAKQIFRDTYPAVYEHLSWFEPKLRKRTDQGKFWWELRACAYYSEFSRYKIIWPDITNTTRFAIDSSGSLIDMTGFFTPGLDRAYAAILNSSISFFILSFLTYSLRGGYLRLKTQYMSLFPIPQLTRDTKQALSDCLNESMTERLDELISQTYKLSNEEFKLIQHWKSQLKSRYDRSQQGEIQDGEADE